jgi:hypothetical protein
MYPVLKTICFVDIPKKSNWFVVVQCYVFQKHACLFKISSNVEAAIKMGPYSTSLLSSIDSQKKAEMKKIYDL